MTAINRSERLTENGLLILRLGAGVLFLLPGLYKFAAPDAFETMLAHLPGFLAAHRHELFQAVAWSEVIGGVALLAGFNLRLAVAPLVIIILAASLFVVRFDTTSHIQMLSLYAHAMALGVYGALFLMGSGRWSFGRGQNLFRFIARRRWGAISRLASDLISGWSRNRGVFLLRASTALPFFVVAAASLFGIRDGLVLPSEPVWRAALAALTLAGGLSIFTGFRANLMAWPLIGLTMLHLALVAVPDAARSQIGLINILFHVLVIAALLALRLIRLGSDLEVGHILSGDRRNIVVVGGGFAATTFARKLEGELPRAYRLVLIAEENYTVFNPLLAELVGATIQPAHVIAPIRRMLHRSRFIQAQVTEIDFAARRLRYRSGEEIDGLNFEQIVIAPGARAKLDVAPGMADHAFPFKLLGDALRLRNRVIEQLEAADRCEDAVERAWLGSFVVVGGGFSGVEVAGAIHDFVHEARKAYPRLTDADLTVTILHGAERLLPELPASLGDYAARNMRERGLDVRLDTRVESADERGVALSGASRVEAATIVNTVGVEPNELLAALGLPRERGRLVVAGDLSVPGLHGVWALGDAASAANALDGRLAPQTAQSAMEQGRLAASNVRRSLRGRRTKPLRFRSKGSMASIGAQDGIADLFGRWRLTGFPAWLLWRAYYLSMMPTLLRKVQIFVEWTWAMAFAADIVHLRFTQSKTQEG